MSRSGSLRSRALVVVLVSMLASTARANPEPTATYDGRIVGMGGAAVAHVDNATSIAHNPAGLAQVRNSTFSLASALLMVRYRATFAGPGAEQDSPPLIAPVPFIGGGGRITRRLSIGGAFYITTGFGGTFRNIRRLDDYQPRSPCPNAAVGSTCIPGGPASGNDPEVVVQTVDEQVIRLFVTEVAGTVSYSILDNLRVGLSLRLPWAQQSTSSMQETLANSWSQVNQNVRGFGIPSATVGVQWEPIPDLAIGFVYRARAAARMSGTNTLRLLGDMSAEETINASTQWVVPHMLRVGVSGWLVQRRLLLSFEFRAQFHSRANRAQSFDLTSDSLQTILDGSGLNPFVARFDWYNVYYPTFGAEYQVADHWWLRFGTSVGLSATPPQTASPFAPPPGLSYSFTAGLGGEFGRWRVDLGYQQAINGPYTVEQRNATNCANNAQQKSGCDGTYNISAYTFGLSLGYNN